jgi:hypothetical protein
MILVMTFQPHLLLTITWLKNLLITRKIRITEGCQTLKGKRKRGKGETIKTQNR